MKYNLQHKLTILSLLAIFSFSTFAATFAYAAPLAVSEKDWQYVNGNSWGWNYSPETQINKNNVQNLEVKWLFPLGSKSSVAASMKFVQTMNGGEGSTTPPIVRNGVVYVTTNFMRTYAIEAKTGKQLWTNDYTINLTEVQNRLPVSLGPRIHLHGIRYWEGGDVILLSGLACDIYGINAKDGKVKFWIKDLCVNVPGNVYKYYQYAGFEATTSQTNIGTYDKGRQFSFVLPGSVHSTAIAGDSRHVTMGVGMDEPYNIQWRIFSYPPQDVPTKDWALLECSTGYFADIPCSEVAAKAPKNLEWDWAQPGEKPSIWGGVTANWGQSIVDEESGILYTQTGNQGPFTYVGATPGPRLYGSAIMAIDMTSGKRIWWNQPFPRDPYDYDCNWSGILANDPTLGKVYVKGCKEGRLQVLNAATGKPHYLINVIDEQYKWGQITKAGTLEPNQGGIKYHLNDPFSYYDMREMKSPDNSTYCGRPCPVFPAWGNGLFQTDASYDPTTSTLFHYAGGLQTTILESRPPVIGQSYSITRGGTVTNATIVARDLATGKVNWTWFYSFSTQRSAMAVTPDLVFAGFTDGKMRFFDKAKGTLLNELNIGSDMGVGVTTGQDSDGNQKIFTIVGSRGITPATPGTVVAVGLSTKAAEAKTTTVTTATTNTVTTTSITTSVSTSATTVTSATTSTITSNAPAQTVTTTREVTQSTGLPSEVTYAAVGVAVIALIAAAVLVMRKK